MSHGRFNRPAKMRRLTKRHNQGKHNLMKDREKTKCPLCTAR